LLDGRIKTADLSLSLDVIYHLVEDHIFEQHMSQLFSSARRFVAIYASNSDRKAPVQHVRHRNFTAWADANAKDWKLVEKVPNRYPFDESDPEGTSFADFYFYTRAPLAPACY
jgi:hypothetical protein